MVPMGIRLPFRFVMSTPRAIFVGLLPMPLVKVTPQARQPGEIWMNRSQITRSALPVSFSLRMVTKLKLLRRMPIQPTDRTVGREIRRMPGRNNTSWYRATAHSRRSPILRQYGDH
jgi:hypothetical protein